MYIYLCTNIFSHVLWKFIHKLTVAMYVIELILMLEHTWPILRKPRLCMQNIHVHNLMALSYLLCLDLNLLNFMGYARSLHTIHSILTHVVSYASTVHT